MQTWIIYALMAAVCAAALNIFGKIGVQNVDSNLATTIRGAVQGGLLLIFATSLGLWSKLPTISAKAWVTIVICGALGAASWLFGFAALKMADASKVSPLDKLSVPLTALAAVLILGERPSPINWVGIFLIAGGAYLTSIKA